MRTFYSLLIIICCGIINGQTFEDGLLLYYPLDGNAVDMSGNGFDGVSTCSDGEDRMGNPSGALDFDGAGQYVIIPNDAILKPELPVTISVWVYIRDFPELPNGFGIFANDDTEDAIYTGVFMFVCPSGQINISYGDGGVTTSTSRRTLYSEDPVSLFEWHHVVAVVKGATDMELYIDCQNVSGIYEGSGSGMEYSSSDGSLGRRHNTGDPYEYYNGVMDELAFWNRELSITEIADLCQGANIISDIADIKSYSQVNILPNPNDGNFAIEIQGISPENSKIELFNSIGQIIYSENLNGSTNYRVLQNLENCSGLIYYKLTSASGIISSGTIDVMK